MLGLACCLMRKFNGFEMLCTLGFFNVSAGLIPPRSIHGAAGLGSLWLISGDAWTSKTWCVVFSVRCNPTWKFNVFEMLCTLRLCDVIAGRLTPWSDFVIARLVLLWLTAGTFWSSTIWVTFLAFGCGLHSVGKFLGSAECSTLRLFIVSVRRQPPCNILSVAGLGARCLDIGAMRNCTSWCIVFSSMALLGIVRFGSLFSLSAMDFSQLGSSLAVRRLARLGSSLSVLHFSCFGASLALRGLARCNSSLAQLGMARSGASLSLLDFLHLGAIFSLRGLFRCSSSLATLGVARLGSLFSLSAMDFTRFGSSLAVRSVSRLGSSLSVLDFFRLGASLAVRGLARCGSVNVCHMPCIKGGLPAHLAFLTADHNPQMALQQSRS
mmetsp:Transcript_135300/g.269944  ORF Transcript_135300/g.269944 Transcript_135300/m.269944 type:complete len:381 (+) Transcript_135300:228-1370(+)